MIVEQIRPRGHVAVVIPAYRAASTIAGVLAKVGPEVGAIYLIDDACPEQTAALVLRECEDPRLVVVRNLRNLGVGGAVKEGYRRAVAGGAEIVVKIDADGQMDPRHIGRLIAPIVEGRADYAKGNRFAPTARPAGGARGAQATPMPWRRYVANRLLSLVHGSATGYWRIGDPANGYVAIHRSALERIGADGVADCFFFETDMLCRLNSADARVVDVALPALYPGSGSTLKLRRVALRFAALLASRTIERLWRRIALGGRHAVVGNGAEPLMPAAAAAAEA